MSDATQLLTPTDQERALIATLRHFEVMRRGQPPVADAFQIFVRVSAAREDREGQEVPLKWTVGLTLGAWFLAEGEGNTFAAAWDGMVKEGDDAFDQMREEARRVGVKPTEAVLSEVIRDWVAQTPSLTAQESELVMSLRRRGAKGDDYELSLEVNGEDNPGQWSVTERKDVVGAGATFDAAWDERF
jgi:hypothetical protein